MALYIVRNDITKVAADAIVNTANPRPIFANGTDGAIYKAAGKEKLLAARKKIGNIAPGEAVETPAFNLAAKYIIHTVGPSWVDGKHGEAETLKSCYEKSLQLAQKLKCQSIAFPLIATGVYGFPKNQALRIALSVIQDFLLEHRMKVTMVVFSEEAFQLTGQISDRIREYVDANYVENAYKNEYDDGYPNLNRRAQMARWMEEYRETQFRGVSEKHAEEASEDVIEGVAGKAAEGVIEGVAGEAAEKNFYCGNVLESPVRVDAEYWPEADEEAEELDSGEPVSDASMPEAPAPKTKHTFAEMKEHFAYKSAYHKVDFDELLRASEKTFQEKLFEIIDSRNLTGPQVYSHYVSKQVFSKIQKDKDYHPNKFTALALCMSLHLNLDQTLDLIGRAGWTLSPSSKADIVVKGCILNRVYNLVDVNMQLSEYHCLTLDHIK